MQPMSGLLRQKKKKLFPNEQANFCISYPRFHSLFKQLCIFAGKG
jgi:hypothetical protein